MIRVSVVGAAGYSGAEAVRLPDLVTADGALRTLPCHLAAEGGQLVFSRLQSCPALEPALRRALLPGQGGFLAFADDDLAIEWCENQLLAHLAYREETREATSLDDFAFFANLEVPEKQALQGLLRPAHYAAGELVIEDGANNDARVFLLLSGEVSVLIKVADGHQQRLATLCHGMVFGEMALLTGEPRSATVSAQTDTELLRLRKEDLRAIFTESPQVEEMISEVLAERKLKTDQARQEAAEERSSRGSSLVGQEGLNQLSKQILAKIRDFFSY